MPQERPSPTPRWRLHAGISPVQFMCLPVPPYDWVPACKMVIAIWGQLGCPGSAWINIEPPAHRPAASLRILPRRPAAVFCGSAGWLRNVPPAASAFANDVLSDRTGPQGYWSQPRSPSPGARITMLSPRFSSVFHTVTTGLGNIFVYETIKWSGPTTGKHVTPAVAAVRPSCRHAFSRQGTSPHSAVPALYKSGYQ